MMRILYLSNNRSGADIVRGKLAEEGLASDIRTVESRAQFEAALTGSVYDLLLADFSLSSFEIYSVLTMAREKRPDVPFILLSEMPGEELTIEAFKAGATDIVHQRRPLAAAVRRALRDAETWRLRKWEHEELLAEKERLAVTLESLGEAVMVIEDGTIASINKTAETMTGWPYADAVGKPLSDVFSLLDGETRRPCAPVTTGSLARALLVDKTGTPRPISYAGTTIRDRRGTALGMVVSFHEASEPPASAHELSIEKKLDALRAFADGIANHCREELTSLVGHIAMAKHTFDKEKANEPLLSLIKEAERSSIQVKRLIWRLEAFAKSPRPADVTVSVADLILLGKECQRVRAEKKPSIADLGIDGVINKRAVAIGGDV